MFHLPVSPFLNQSAISSIDRVVAPTTPVLLSQALESVSNTNEQMMLPMQNNQGNSLDQTFSVLPTTSAAAEEGLPPLSAEELETLLLSIDHLSSPTTPVLFSQVLESVSNANEQTMLPMQDSQGNRIDKNFFVLPTTSAATEGDLSLLSTEDKATAQKNAAGHCKKIKNLLLTKSSIIKPQGESLFSAENYFLERFQRDRTTLPTISKILKIWDMNQHYSESKRVKFERFAEIFKIDPSQLAHYIEKDTGIFSGHGLKMLSKSRIVQSKEEKILVKQFSCSKHKVYGFLKAWESNQQFPENKRVSFTRFSHLLGVRFPELNQYINKNTMEFKELGLKILHQRH